MSPKPKAKAKQKSGPKQNAGPRLQLKMTRGRWLALVILVFAAVGAVQGGSYSLPSYLRVQQTERAMRDTMRLVHREIDSLKAYQDSISRNSSVQERFARQEWGWVRPGELMMKVTTADSTRIP